MSVDAALEAIWSGHRRGQHHPPEWHGRLTMVEAYHVQLGLLERYVGAGDRHAGWKVGLTAKAMQEQQRVHEPVFGFLLESGRRDTGAIFAFGELIRPGFENESATRPARAWCGAFAAAMVDRMFSERSETPASQPARGQAALSASISGS